MGNMRQVLDWNLAKERAGGDLTVAKELCEKFVHYLPVTKESICSAYKRQQFDELARQVHSLLGAASYCGFPNLLRTLQDLDDYLFEMASRDPQQAYLPSLMTKLETDIADIMAIANQVGIKT